MIPAWVKGTLLLAVTLVAGVGIGVAYERQRAPAHDAAAMDSRHLMRRLHQHLDLDSAQHAEIVAIMARRQRSVDSSWHEVQPHVRATLDSTLREIVTVLRPEQAAKYREMVQAMHPGAPSRQTRP